VGASKEEPPQEPPSSRDGGAPLNASSSRRKINATAKLALWPGPATSPEIVTFGEPVPLIHVESIAAPERVDPRVVLLSDPASDAARSYRLLRHRLFGLGDPRTIAVTSARTGEGKT